MKTWSILGLAVALMAPAASSLAAQGQAKGANVPRYDVAWKPSSKA